jgi:hypothetical protein
MTISEVDITQNAIWKIMLALVKYVMILCSCRFYRLHIYSVCTQRYIFKKKFLWV